MLNTITPLLSWSGVEEYYSPPLWIGGWIWNSDRTKPWLWMLIKITLVPLLGAIAFYKLRASYHPEK